MVLVIIQSGVWGSLSEELLLVNVKTKELVIPDRNVSKIMNERDYTNLMAEVFPPPGLLKGKHRYEIRAIL